MCFPKGEGGTGECLYCTNALAYGPYCDEICDCDTTEYYCDSGTTGQGCTKFDYGGIKIPYPYYTYGGVGIALLAIFFTMTWCKAKEQFPDDIPFLPRKHSYNEDIDTNFNNSNNVEHIHNASNSEHNSNRNRNRNENQRIDVNANANENYNLNNEQRATKRNMTGNQNQGYAPLEDQLCEEPVQNQPEERFNI